MNKIQQTALALYVLIGVLSFGHSWNREWLPREKESGGQLLASMASGALWPLYVSVVIFEK